SRKPIFYSIQLIKIVLAPQVVSTVADITNLDHSVLVDLTLVTEAKRIDRSCFQSRIERVRRVGDGKSQRVRGSSQERCRCQIWIIRIAKVRSNRQISDREISR